MIPLVTLYNTKPTSLPTPVKTPCYTYRYTNDGPINRVAGWNYIDCATGKETTQTLLWQQSSTKCAYSGSARVNIQGTITEIYQFC